MLIQNALLEPIDVLTIHAAVIHALDDLRLLSEASLACCDTAVSYETLEDFSVFWSLGVISCHKAHCWYKILELVFSFTLVVRFQSCRIIYDFWIFFLQFFYLGREIGEPVFDLARELWVLDLHALEDLVIVVLAPSAQSWSLSSYWLINVFLSRVQFHRSSTRSLIFINHFNLRLLLFQIQQILLNSIQTFQNIWEFYLWVDLVFLLIFFERT